MSSLRNAVDNILKKFPPSEWNMYSGTTDVNGEFSVTFNTNLAIAPKVVPVLKTDDKNYMVSVSSSTVSGFTVKVQHNRTGSVSGDLKPDLLASPNVEIEVMVYRGEG